MRILATFLIFCGLSLVFSKANTVYACGGGASDNIQNLLERSDYVVKADVVSVDDIRQNAILSVDHYLYGGAGPEYLLFLQNDLVTISRVIEGEPYNNCETFKPELRPGLTAYFFLTRRTDGVYISGTQRIDPNYYAFTQAETTITLYSRNDDASYEDHVLDESGFVDFVTTFGESTVTEPDATLPFPRMAPLKITTDSGTAYILPIDSNTPIEVTDDWLSEINIALIGFDTYDFSRWNEAHFLETTCPGEGCVKISPDGVFRAIQNGDEIQWNDGTVPGRTFEFSSAGDAIAIWHENQLQFYTLGWQKRDQPFDDVTMLNSGTLSGEIDTLPTEIAWSPDGRFAAFSDSQGLWSLDVYDPAAESVLLLAAEEDTIPVALNYSPLGRYLQVEKGSKRFTLDTHNGDVFPDGLVSPDDQILLAFDTQAESFDIEICYLAPVRECTTISPRVLHDENDNARAFTRYTQVQWRNTYSFITIVCERDDDDDCVVNGFRNTNGGGLWHDLHYFPGSDQGHSFAYFPDGDVLAVVRDGNTIAINDAELDFSSVLDGEIVEIEWLSSYFYSASD